MFRKIVIGSLIGCMLIVGAASSVYAQSENPPVCAPETDLLETLDKTREEIKSALDKGKTIEDLFDEAGLNYEAYLQEFAEVQLDCINQAVEDGKITETQAERMITAVEKGLEEGKPFFLGHRLVKHSGIQKLRFLSFDNIADSLGLSAAELKTALEDGQTIAEIAEEAGMDLDAIYQDWISEKMDAVQVALEEGKITQVRADKITERLENQLDEGFPFGFLKRIRQERGNLFPFHGKGN